MSRWVSRRTEKMTTGRGSALRVSALVIALSAMTGAASAQGLITIPHDAGPSERPDISSYIVNTPLPALELDALSMGDRETAVSGPISGRERVDWIVNGVVGPTSLGFTAFSAASDVWWTRPSEQARAARFARGFAIRELDLAISRSVEAGLGSLWDEDPRPWQGSGRGFWSKTGRALQRVVLAPRADGHLAPAWGRFAGYAASGIAANAWVPQDQRTVQDTVLRIGSAFTGRLISNVWKEFWPDLKERLPEPPWARRAEPTTLPR
jgi:hypothetical protein